MTRITAQDGSLTIEVEGLHKALTFKNRMTIPLAHVRQVTDDPAGDRRPPAWRVLGSNIPGIVTAGTFGGHGEREFWDVRHPGKAIVVELADEYYTRLVLEVDDPQSTIDMIEQARL